MDNVEYKIEETGGVYTVFRRSRRDFTEDFSQYEKWKSFFSEKDAVEYIKDRLKYINK